MDRLPIEVGNDPTRAYRIGQIIGAVIGGTIGGVLYFPANEPLFAIAPLFIGGWSLVFGEIQVRFFAPRKKTTYTVDARQVSCIRGAGTDVEEAWTEPISNYVLEHRQDFKGGGQQGGTNRYYVLELKHLVDDTRSVIVSMESKVEVSLENHEAVAKKLGIPATTLPY
ncbi:MAG: hypothetical protein HOK30_20475 [Rhodospirillaceae bacterium]|nr:hypothetical protein [Rhodospirillaceae bacterium]MBT5194555.1 hypothetical protein [Rhodospirillaceae bacterium]MBT6430057.1 hypothetical protein [Rhodospirillaceae bacterium]